MPLHEGLAPLLIESSDQLCHRITAPPASGASGCFVARAIRNREQFLGSCHLGGWITARAAQVLKVATFIGVRGRKASFW
jgi:hypothetical protein